MKISTRAPSDEQRRDYYALAERVRSLRVPGWDVREQGEVCGLPLFAAERAPTDHATIPQVLVFGGIHGNEPAGVEAVVPCSHHTSHTFCSETPLSFPMEQRVRAHQVALQTALAHSLPDPLSRGPVTPEQRGC